MYAVSLETIRLPHTNIIARLIPKADRKKIHEYLFRGMP